MIDVGFFARLVGLVFCVVCAPHTAFRVWKIFQSGRKSISVVKITNCDLVRLIAAMMVIQSIFLVVRCCLLPSLLFSSRFVLFRSWNISIAQLFDLFLFCYVGCDADVGLRGSARGDRDA